METPKLPSLLRIAIADQIEKALPQRAIIDLPLLLTDIPILQFIEIDPAIFDGHIEMIELMSIHDSGK
jgi:hypothetical protein